MPWLLAAGAFRFAFYQPTFDETHIAFYNDGDTPITITGLVVDEPDVHDYYVNFRLRAESLQSGDTFQPVEGMVLDRAPRYPEHFYGNRLTITGNWKRHLFLMISTTMKVKMQMTKTSASDIS